MTSKGAIAKPTKPAPEHVAYWANCGWKHTGLGLFKDKHGHRARLHVYADGSTGMRVLDFCAIQGDLRRHRT